MQTWFTDAYIYIYVPLGKNEYLRDVITSGYYEADTQRQPVICLELFIECI